jgi:hypothetical protein
VAQRKSRTKTKRPARQSVRPASRKTKSSTRTTKQAHKPISRGQEEVTIDRRRAGRRQNGEQSDATNQSNVLPARLERRKKVNRRRQIDPTTCERDYTDDEIQFMNALDEYKRTSGRMFPTCSEVLEVVRSLGYVKLSPGESAARSAVETAAPIAGSPAAMSPLAGASAGEQP